MEEKAQTTQEVQTTAELGGAQSAGGDPTTSTQSAAEKADKTFTQAEVNDLIKQRLDRERKTGYRTY